MSAYQHDGVAYFCNGKTWVDENNMSPPASVRQYLNRQREKELAAIDATITDPERLCDEARSAQAVGQLNRAIKLAARAWRLDRRHEGRAAFLSSLLREAHRPEDALLLLNFFPKISYNPLMVTAAAALCDVERWEEAYRMIAKALASSKGTPAGEAFAVWHRINKERPDLIPR